MGYEDNDPAALRSIAHRNLTKSMQTLLGICTGIAADNHINDHEVHFLKSWLIENESITDKWPWSVIAGRVSQILRDGIISEEERDHLLQTLKEITGNYFTDTGSEQAEITGIPFDTTPLIFSQKVFCFTGSFIFGTRNECRRITEKMGAVTVDTMTKKVDYLVIGAIGSPDWVHESFGHKIANAMQLKSKNHPVAIVAEKHWNNAFQLSS
jgi:NAD-dependent DNA ligase